MPTYVLENGKYCWKDASGRTLYSCEEMAFLYDTDTLTLHSHGAPENVRSYLLKIAPFLPVAMIQLDKSVSLEDINRCLDTTGYLRTFLAKYGTEVR